MIKRNSLVAIKMLKAYFSAILWFSSLLVNKSQDYMEMRDSSIQWKTWREKDSRENEKGRRSSVGYARKPYDYRSKDCKKYYSDNVKSKQPIPFQKLPLRY